MTNKMIPETICFVFMFVTKKYKMKFSSKLKRTCFFSAYTVFVKGRFADLNIRGKL